MRSCTGLELSLAQNHQAGGNRFNVVYNARQSRMIQEVVRLARSVRTRSSGSRPAGQEFWIVDECLSNANVLLHAPGIRGKALMVEGDEFRQFSESEESIVFTYRTIL